jgi:hypothetical protein
VRYTALYSGVTDDPAFSGMSMVGQLTWFFLLSCKHGNMLGLFQLPTMYAACDWHWTIEQVEAGLGEVEQSGLIRRQGDMIWIVNYLKYNTLKGGKRDAGGAAIARSLPDCRFKAALAVIADEMGFDETASALRYHGITFKTNGNNEQSNDEGLPNDCQTIANPLPIEHIPNSGPCTGPCTGPGTTPCTTAVAVCASETKPATYSQDFDAFWQAYPRKTAKGAAFKAFDARRKAGTLPALSVLIQSVQEHMRYDRAWRRDGGQYIPHPATFLNQERWLDDFTVQHEPSALEIALARRKGELENAHAGL